MGIDIRDTGTAAVQIKKTLKASWIESYIHIPVSDSDPEQGDSAERLAQSLKLISEKMDLKGSQCIVSFPADRISFRNLQVPFRESKKIRQILPFELEPHLPISTEELVSDFIPIHVAADHTELIAAVLEKSEFKSFLDTFSGYHIDPETITIGGYPVALILNQIPDSPKTWVLIDADRAKATLFLIVSGRLSLIRSFSTGLDLHHGPGLLCGNILRTVSAFEDTLGMDLAPESVYVTGVGLPESAVEDEMAKLLELPVRRVNLLASAGLALPADSAQAWKSQLMDNALALALTEVRSVDCLNFRKDTFSVRKQWHANRKQIISTGLAAALALCLALFGIAVDSYHLKQNVNEIDSRMTQIFRTSFPEITHIVDPVQQMKVLLKEAEKTSFSSQAESNPQVIDIINEISRLIPKQIDVDLDRLAIDEESVLISGQTDTFNSVDDIKSRLERSDFFDKVTISSANMDRTDNRVRFKLKMML